jgi:hypothetical protein
MGWQLGQVKSRACNFCGTNIPHIFQQTMIVHYKQCFFYWQIFAKIRPENVISTNTKDFS